ncbi:MAG: prolyl oligopeptidase family serine peptidase [Mycobacteriales bacterium]
MTAPATRTVEHVDDFFGTAVPDPYRWLEDADSEEVRDWVAAQGAATRGYLDTLPGRDAITARLSALWNLPKSFVPVHRGERWFRRTNDGEQQQDVLRVADSPMGDGTVLIDPNPLAPDGSTALSADAPSDDGSLVAYSLSEAGSDWQTWRVRDVASGTDLDDVIRWAKFTMACWLPSGDAFVYGGFEPPVEGQEYAGANRGHRLYVHLLGTPQESDELLIALPDEPDWLFAPEVTEDDRWLVVTAAQGTNHETRVWVRDLTEAGDVLHPLIGDADAEWRLVTSLGAELLFLTDKDATRRRLVAIDVKSGAQREVLAEGDDLLEDAVATGGRLAVHRLHDAHSVVSIHSLNGARAGEIPLPGLGSVVEISARSQDSLLHVGFTSFESPEMIVSYDVETGGATTVFQVDLGDEPGSVVTEQTWITSRDGTELPVFLTHRRDLTASAGPHPALLYGYGGFRISMTPAFNLVRYAFAAAGGVVAIPSLRGGGEYGVEWHDGGRLAHKQNVFDDAIATADYLIASGWTDTEHLATNGGSNGGLLAGALVTQRPDLFAAVVPEVGVLDMLRFQHFTIGWAWTSDYGDANGSEEEFQTLLAYSPLHRLSEGTAYPPVMIMTGDHDDRVVPAHSFKFAARLQAVSAPDALALLRVETSTGHGAGKPRHAIIAERVDFMAFVSAHTGLSWPTL